MITLPEAAASLIARLNEAGYKAYAVGGCVRDSLLGLQPKDWDICTSALPDEMLAVFSGEHVLDIGLKHGTLTVMREGVSYEITTFRLDGAYTDHRHPDRVAFVSDVRDDLARRDFTVNAMAWHPDEGLIDAFHGLEDLRAGVIRCVGDPLRRFDEDALRILRALRFAAVYGFAIDKATLSAGLDLAETLERVASERKRVELVKLLCGDAAAPVMRSAAGIITQVIPELKPCLGFAQHNPHHVYDVWEHTLRTVEAAPKDETLRLAALLHDVGKPPCYTMDAQGIGHFYGHPAVSAQLAEDVLRRLRFDNKTEAAVLSLVKHHDLDLGDDDRLMRRRLMQLGENCVRGLIELQRADAIGTGTCTLNRADERAETLRQRVNRLMAEEACFQLKDLAVNGRDMMSLGFTGAAIGQALQSLLEAVVDGRVANEKQALMACAETMKRC